MSGERDRDVIDAVSLLNAHSRRQLTVLVHLKLLCELADALLELGEEVLLELVNDVASQLHLVLQRSRVVFDFAAEELVALRQTRQLFFCHILSAFGDGDQVALNGGFFLDDGESLGFSRELILQLVRHEVLFP